MDSTESAQPKEKESNHYTIELVQTKHEIVQLAWYLHDKLNIDEAEIQLGLQNLPWKIPYICDDMHQVRVISHEIYQKGGKVFIQTDSGSHTIPQHVEEETASTDTETAKTPRIYHMKKYLIILICVVLLLNAYLAFTLISADKTIFTTNSKSESVRTVNADQITTDVNEPDLSTVWMNNLDNNLKKIVRRFDTNQPLEVLRKSIQEENLTSQQKKQYADHFLQLAEQRRINIVKFYQFAISFNPDNLTAWSNLYQTYLLQGERELAKNLLTQLAKEYPEEAVSLAMSIQVKPADYTIDDILLNQQGK